MDNFFIKSITFYYTENSDQRFSHDHPLHDVPLSVRDVFVTGGASTSLEFAFQAIANPGHNILLPMPGWQYYRTLCQANNISCRRYRIKFHPEANAQIDLKNLEEKIDANTRAILVNNPTNPHGAVLPREQLEALLAIAEKHKVLFTR
jgi:tyrosine aminotransferase